MGRWVRAELLKYRKDVISSSDSSPQLRCDIHVTIIGATLARSLLSWKGLTCLDTFATGTSRNRARSGSTPKAFRGILYNLIKHRWCSNLPEQQRPAPSTAPPSCGNFSFSLLAIILPASLLQEQVQSFSGPLGLRWQCEIELVVTFPAYQCHLSPDLMAASTSPSSFVPMLTAWETTLILENARGQRPRCSAAVSQHQHLGPTAPGMNRILQNSPTHSLIRNSRMLWLRVSNVTEV